MEQITTFCWYSVEGYLINDIQSIGMYYQWGKRKTSSLRWRFKTYIWKSWQLHHRCHHFSQLFNSIDSNFHSSFVSAIWNGIFYPKNLMFPPFIIWGKGSVSLRRTTCYRMANPKDCTELYTRDTEYTTAKCSIILTVSLNNVFKQHTSLCSSKENV